MSASLIFPLYLLTGLGMGSQSGYFSGNLPFTLSRNFRSKILKAAPHPDRIFKVPCKTWCEPNLVKV